MSEHASILFASLRGPTQEARRGGAQDYLRFVAGPWTQAGYRVRVLCGYERLPDGTPLPQTELVDGIEVERIGTNGRDIRALRVAVREAAPDADLVIENIMGFPLLLPWGVPSDTPLVAIKHHFQGATFFRSQGRLRGLVGRSLEDVAQPLVYRYVPMIVPSAMTAEHIARQWVRHRAALAVIPPGIPQPAVTSSARADAPTILYVGGLHLARKRVDHLLDAFEMVRKTQPEAQLWVAGDGPDRAYLEAQAGPGVSFFGFVTEEEKARLYEQAWVFASPSMQEGFGITWVEANSYGLPVIGYQIAGLNTVDETCALMVEPGNQSALAAGLQRVLSDDALRAQLAEGGRKNASRFSWARTSKDVLAFALEASGLQTSVGPANLIAPSLSFENG
ncbi:MAG: glycosyltransferase family 4 protein [Bacteroidota bacterium]